MAARSALMVRPVYPTRTPCSVRLSLWSILQRGQRQLTGKPYRGGAVRLRNCSRPAAGGTLLAAELRDGLGHVLTKAGLGHPGLGRGSPPGGGPPPISRRVQQVLPAQQPRQ